MGRTLGQAQACVDVLGSTRWQVFDVIRDLDDARREPAAGLLQRVAEALTHDEHVTPLKARLEELERDALRLLAQTPPPPVVAPVAPPPPAPDVPIDLPLAPKHELIEEKVQAQLSPAAAAMVLDELKARLAGDPDLELTLSWRLQRRGKSA